jgi:Sap, sulfolipid-1-addressing protein
VIDWLILVLFLFLMVRTYRRRKDTTTPKWMGRIQTADVGFSFRLGLLLFLAMPTDILTMFTVGASLTRHGQLWWHGLPFVLVTRLLVGLPLLGLLLLGKRGEDLLPKVRDWMTNNTRRVEPRAAPPVDRAIGGDQRRSLQVTDQPMLGDRRIAVHGRSSPTSGVRCRFPAGERNVVRDTVRTDHPIRVICQYECS